MYKQFTFWLLLVQVFSLTKCIFKSNVRILWSTKETDLFAQLECTMHWSRSLEVLPCVWCRLQLKTNWHKSNPPPEPAWTDRVPVAFHCPYESKLKQHWTHWQQTEEAEHLSLWALISRVLLSRVDLNPWFGFPGHPYTIQIKLYIKTVYIGIFRKPVLIIYWLAVEDKTKRKTRFLE